MTQKSVFLVVVLVVLVPLAGCADESGGAGDPTATPPTTTTTSPPTAPSTTVTPTSASTTPTPTPTPAPPTTTTTISTPTPAPTPTATDSDEESPITGGTVRTATVTRVVDGDTVEVEFSDGTADTIRLLGVDTPETIASNQDPSDFEGLPDTSEGRDWLLNWGEEAKTYAEEQLAGKQVRVVMDPASDERGSFGRLLAYIYVDGSNVNQVLLERGLARVYDSSFSLRDDFYQSEDTAQSNDRGL